MSEGIRKAPAWATVKLADVAIFRGGNGFPERYQGQTEGLHPFIKVADLSYSGNERQIHTARNWLTKDLLNKIRPVLHPPGAVVFAKVGAALKLNRRRILIRPTAIDNNMMSVEAGNKLDPAFLFILMETLDLADFCQDGGLPSVNQANLGQFEFLLPSLAEQRRIVAVLSCWDQGATILEHIVDKKRHLRSRIARHLFSTQPLAEIAKLRDVCRPRQWPTPGKGALIEEGIPVFGANGIIGFTDNSTHGIETIAVGCRGSVGEMHRVQPPAYITGNAMALDELDSKRVYLPFLYHYLINVGFKDQISGSSQPQITQADMRAKPVWLPNIAQQKLIGNVLDAAEREIGQLNALLDRLRVQKRGLAQKLLTGTWLASSSSDNLIKNKHLTVEAAE